MIALVFCELLEVAQIEKKKVETHCKFPRDVPFKTFAHGNCSDDHVRILCILKEAFAVTLHELEQFREGFPVYLRLNNIDFDIGKYLEGLIGPWTFGRTLWVRSGL